MSPCGPTASSPCAVNVVAGNVLRPILLLLDLELAVDAKLLKSHHSHRNAKATVARDKLVRTMNGLCHVEQKVNCFLVPLHLVLAWEGPSPVGLLQVILSLDDLDPPHDWLPTVAVRDRMIFVVEWMRLAREWKPGQNLFRISHVFTDSSMHETHDGLYPLE